jgi:hypothetical protein
VKGDIDDERIDTWYCTRPYGVFSSFELRTPCTLFKIDEFAFRVAVFRILAFGHFLGSPNFAME